MAQGEGRQGMQYAEAFRRISFRREGVEKLSVGFRADLTPEQVERIEKRNEALGIYRETVQDQRLKLFPAEGECVPAKSYALGAAVSEHHQRATGTRAKLT